VANPVLTWQTVVVASPAEVAGSRPAGPLLLPIITVSRPPVPVGGSDDFLLTATTVVVAYYYLKIFRGAPRPCSPLSFLFLQSFQVPLGPGPPAAACQWLLHHLRQVLVPIPGLAASCAVFVAKCASALNRVPVL
jgi:hypothetical protein